MVLGGLVGDKIGLVPERVRKMNERIKGWVGVRSTPVQQRKVAIVVYGFPPNVGAVSDMGRRWKMIPGNYTDICEILNYTYGLTPSACRTNHRSPLDDPDLSGRSVWSSSCCRMEVVRSA